MTGHHANREDGSLPVAATTAPQPLAVRSPGIKEGVPKDQDRAAWVPLPSGGIASVCDGTGSSVYADEAAQYVIDFVDDHQQEWLTSPFFDSSAHRLIGDLVAELLRLREDAAGREVKTAYAESDPIRPLVEANVLKKRRSSHQTTIISARLESASDSIRLRWFQCGDSELIVYAPTGWVRHTTAKLRPAPRREHAAASVHAEQGRLAQFDHRTSVTSIIPDTLIGTVPSIHEIDCPLDSRILLASDGLLDAFAGPRDVFSWFHEHEHLLEDPESRDEVLAALHQRRDGIGDDDISFVWIPAVAPRPTPEADTEQSGQWRWTPRNPRAHAQAPSPASDAQQEG